MIWRNIILLTLSIASYQKVNKMKKILFLIFQSALGFIVIGKLSNWIFHFSDETNLILNSSMFILIGVAYLVGAFIWDKKMTNAIFFICGAYLIIMNFIGDSNLKAIFGIICILTPMLIIKFLPVNTDEKPLAKA